MCGIYGLINFSKEKLSKFEIDKLKNLNEIIFLRGPDEKGFYHEKNFFMGMRRLSIIDLEGGSQPIKDSSGDISVIFNGEIYNYIELKDELISKGYNFKTKSDTEVLIYCYLEYGHNCINKLNGMFSFCLFNKSKHEILLARDRFGKKPLYYYKNKNVFIFSSSLNLIQKYFNDSLAIDENSFLLLNLFSYVPKDKTIYKNIKKLLPGSKIIIDNDNFTIKKYFEFKPNNNQYELKNLLTRSVQIQSRSDVSVGSLLSGGLDSSLISKLHSLIYIKNRIKTFSYNFFDKKFSEEFYSNVMSKNINSIHHISKSQKINLSEITNIIELLDEPIIDTAIFTSFKLSELAKKNNVKVILSGAGGDELFGGYIRYFQNIRNHIHNLIKIPNFIIKIIISLNFHKFANFILISKYKIIRYISSTSGSNIAFLYSNLKLNSFSKLISLTLDYKKEMKLYEKIFGSTKAKMIFDLNNYLPDNILAIADKTTMLNSIEGRFPFLDNNILNLVLSNKFKNYKFKKILKSSYEDILPYQVIKRSKRGFNIPKEVIISDLELINIKKEILNSNIFILNKYFDLKKIYNNFDYYIHNGCLENILCIYFFIKWYERNCKRN